MANKVYEISFAIAGKMGSNFNTTFSGASSRMQQLNVDMKQLNAQYKKGELSVEQYSAKQGTLARKIRDTHAAQDLLNRGLKKQHDLTSRMTSSAFGSVRNTLSLGAGAVALGGGFILGSSIKKAMDYEAQLASIQALTGINNKELGKMDELALKMGADTKYSALQAAQGIEELLKAGMSPATVQAGGLESALNLATAGGLDLTAAAEMMSDALNGFKKDGMSAADAANILAGAANASSTDVTKIAEGLSQIGPVADGIGVSFRGVNATLAAFSNNMLKGSDAGTSFKTFLTNVQPQTKEASALFAKYGLTAKDGSKNIFFANGRLKDMADVAEVLKEKFKNLNEQQRSDIFSKMFGSDSKRSALILFKEGSKGINEMYKQMSDVTALEVARKKMDSTAGSVEQFKGALETLQIRALRPILPVIKKVFEQAGNIVEKWTPRISKAVQDAVDDANSYLHKHYIDNPDFNKLDKQGKFEFVMQDLKKTFDAWYASGGKGQISDTTSSLIGFISEALKGSSKELTSVGFELGTALGTGMFQGVQKMMKDNPELSAVFTYIATPGPPPVKLAAAAAVYANGKVVQLVDNAQQREQDRIDKQATYIQELNKQPNGVPMYHSQLVDPSKTNITSKPTNTTESSSKPSSKLDSNASLYDQFMANPFWFHSFSKNSDNTETKPNVVALTDSWENISQKLGFGKSGDTTFNVTFSPIINGGNKESILPMLKEQQDSFVSQFDNLLNQKWRVSFDK
jgi:TP901 family phage tail tape measure protein